MATHLWLRCETKEFEHRSALTPTTAKKLLDEGFKITVERDPNRIFDDEEFARVGCELADYNSWPNAPKDALIIGLKELPVEDTALPHTHIQFAHCYKQQAGWADVLDRFAKGTPTGLLYDLEFLQDDAGRRVAAFGYHAGFAGAAAGLMALAEQVQGRSLGRLSPYPNEHAMISECKKAVETSQEKLGRPAKGLVIGALGRCGRGAVDLMKAAGLKDENILKWDMAETAKGGPFPELLDVDVFVNCIYLTSKIPFFLTKEFIESAGPSRALRVVTDVSCDTTNPNNPIPIYNVNTTFDKPTVPVDLDTSVPPMTVISIDHLPTLLPREASEQFSNDLLPSLLQLPSRKSARVWTEAEKLYLEKKQEALHYIKSKTAAA